MLEAILPPDPDSEEIELLEEWLPMLDAKERAFIKGATKALLYAQEDTDLPDSRFWPHKTPGNSG